MDTNETNIPEVLEVFTGIRVMNADGWGRAVGKYPARHWAEPITLDEFNARAAESTIEQNIRSTTGPASSDRTWDREEVIELCRSAHNYGEWCPGKDFDDWLIENFEKPKTE